ncbi:hypothetical protein [Methylocystis suflitae]|uniref:hypothetical protein n=1 Tax=Methylocystis suflitae TaxID=2951405 RepID=UPI00210F1E60|nr:hypothetical protein [Methylocystis suflitae]MCQ4191423.1 hypothetical protein [Methylocystis suflitae]
MEKLSRIGLSALVTGSVASVISTAALAALAKLEGRGALEPTNATSHWLWGRKSRGRRDVDVAHTAVGYATHHASAVFWALPFEAWLAMQPPRSTFELIGDAAMMSGIAATVDYGVAPKRITPGWELALSDRSMVAAFAALAVGLACGAAASRALLGEAEMERR